MSAGAACSSGKVGQSHVLDGHGAFARDRAGSAIRVSIGAATTEQDIAAFLAAWKAMRGDSAARGMRNWIDEVPARGGAQRSR